MRISTFRFRSNARQGLRAALALWSAGIVAASAYGQSALDVNPLIGIVPTGSYSLSDIESVSNASGNVMLNIPIASLPAGRAGLKAGISLIYNSKIYTASASINPAPGASGCSTTATTFHLNSSTIGQGGWSYATGAYVFNPVQLDTHYNTACETPPADQCSANQFMTGWKFSMIFPDGSSHELIPQGGLDRDANGYYANTPNGTVWTCLPSNPNQPVESSTVTGVTETFYSIDGTYALFHIDDTSNYESWTLTFPDGRKIVERTGTQTQYDRNGNYITISHTFTNPMSTYATGSVETTTISDQFNRSITLTQNFMSPAMAGTGASNLFYDTIVTNGYGASLTWNISWAQVQSSQSYQPWDANTVGSGVDTSKLLQLASYPTTSQVVSIQFPAPSENLQYSFDYGVPAANQSAATQLTPYGGELRGMSTSSCARISYTYSLDATGSTSASADYLNIIQNTVASKTRVYAPDATGNQYATAGTYAASSCTAGSSDVTPETWSYTIAGGATGYDALIKGPDGGSTHDFMNIYGMSYKTVYPDGSYVERVWQNNGSVTGTDVHQELFASESTFPLFGPQAPFVNPFVSAQYSTTSNGTGAQTATTLTWVDGNGNVTKTQDYDFVAAANIQRCTTASVSCPAVNQPYGSGSAALLRW